MKPKILTTALLVIALCLAASAQTTTVPFSASMLQDSQNYKKEIRKQYAKTRSGAISPAIDTLVFDSKKEIQKIVSATKDSPISLLVTPSIYFNGKVERIEKISTDIRKIVVKDVSDSSYELQVMLYYTLAGELEAFSSMIVNANMQGNAKLYPVTWMIQPSYMHSGTSVEWKLVKTSDIFYKD